MQHRMAALAQQGIHMELVLDVGSYHGQFGDMIHMIWPQAQVWSVEADPAHAKINPKQITACVSDQAGKWVEFHTLPDHAIKTGASYYKELTEHYASCVTHIMQTTTLDKLCAQHAWSHARWSTSGLVKLDTQGSELDILKGGVQFLTQQQPRYILAEVSHTPYNHDAPHASDVISWLNVHNYKFTDVWDITYRHTQLLQTDLLFERHT